MVVNPVDYRWSSIHGHLGLYTDRLLTRHTVYLALGSDPAAQAQRYRELLNEAIASEDLDISTLAMLGQREAARTKPVRVEATLNYAKDSAGWKLTDAFITHMESMK